MENAIHWLSAEIDADLDLFLSNYNPLVLQNFQLPKDIDGFFFYDKEGFVFLFDKKNNQGAYLSYTPRAISFREDKLVHRQRIGNSYLFYDKKIVIKDSKKFYFIYSKKASRFLTKYFLIQDAIITNSDAVTKSVKSFRSLTEKLVKKFSNKKRKI